MEATLELPVKTIEDKKVIHFIEIFKSEDKKLRIPCANEEIAKRIQASYKSLNN